MEQIIDLDHLGQIDSDMYGLAHMAAWEPYNLHDVQYVARMFSELGLRFANPAQLIPAGQDLL